MDENVAQGADVILSDWLMPGLDGPELCRRLRAEDRSLYTYVILLTVLADKKHTLLGMSDLRTAAIQL